MDSITIRLQDETLEKIKQEADEQEISKSKVIRDWFAERDELQIECDRLRNEKRMILEQREEATELVEYVEEERSWRSAGIGTRVKWWLFGKD